MTEDSPFRMTDADGPRLCTALVGRSQYQCIALALDGSQYCAAHQTDQSQPKPSRKKTHLAVVPPMPPENDAA